MKIRLDIFLTQQYPHLSRHQAQALIKAGKVIVNGSVIEAPAHSVNDRMSIHVIEDDVSYVSRAGIKLAHALDVFHIDVKELVVLDAGLSTGGFTDCLLQKGVARVYGVDVGHGQVHPRIAAHDRVIVMEGVNLKDLSVLPEIVDMVTLDLSFISLTKVVEAIYPLLKQGGIVISLIKPQFEAGRIHLNKKGVVKNPEVYKKVIESVKDSFEEHGFEIKGVVESPIQGGSGNREFLAWFIKK